MAAGSSFILVFILLFTIVAEHLTKAVRVPVSVKDEVYAAYKFKTLRDHKGRCKAG